MPTRCGRIMQFERLMGCTTEDLLRWLPDALGDYYGDCSVEIDGKIWLQSAHAKVRMTGFTRDDRQISLLRIPQLDLQLCFFNLTIDQVQVILERFDLYTRRGGG